MPDPQHGYLPRIDEAAIPEEKLRGYTLNANHPVGGHKARVMRAALGLTQDDWEYLRDQIREGVRTTPVETRVELSNLVVTYRVVIEILGLNGQRAPVITAWLQEPNLPPRLVTAYVAGRRRTT